MASRNTRRAGFYAAIATVVALIATSPVSLASASASMRTGGLTSQPIGHYDFCNLNPAECRIRPRDQRPVRMTEDFLQMITSVNVRVNAEVTPMNDIDIYGREEVWAYPDAGVGDCEDYVLEKRRELARQGTSLANLLITVVRKPDGEGHAVLTIRTDRGDLVLDNLRDEVLNWDQTGYQFLKRQATNHTGRWVSIRESQPAAPLVGAVQ